MSFSACSKSLKLRFSDKRLLNLTPHPRPPMYINYLNEDNGTKIILDTVK